MGVLEGRLIDRLTPQEELCERMRAALENCLILPAGSKSLIVSHSIALGCLISSVLGLLAYAERRLLLRNSISDGSGLNNRS